MLEIKMKSACLKVGNIFSLAMDACLRTYIYWACLRAPWAVRACEKPTIKFGRNKFQRGAVSVEYLLLTAIVALVLFYNFEGKPSAVQLFFGAIRTLYAKFTYSLSRAT